MEDIYAADTSMTILLAVATVQAERIKNEPDLYRLDTLWRLLFDRYEEDREKQDTLRELFWQTMKNENEKVSVS